MKILAIIIGRKNSKRLKRKHHLLINRKKMIQYTLDLLNNNVKKFENIIVSTDDNKIIELTKKYPSFITLQRPKNLSLDKTRPYEVIKYVYKWYKKKFNEVDGIFVFQPTSPLRTQSTVNQLLKIFKKYKMRKSVVSASPISEHPEWMFSMQKDSIRPFINFKSFSKMSQKLKKLYRVNGLGYLITPKDIISQKTLIPENSIPCISSSLFENIDIDTKDDLIKARLYSEYLKTQK